MIIRWCLKRWRIWIRPVVMIVYGLIILVVLPLCSLRLQKENVSPYAQAWFTGGIFVLMALPITFWEMTQHLVHYTKPYLQKHVIRILWMVPIYALNAWLAMTYPSTAVYLDTGRECYEAYVIYNFMVFLLNFLYCEVDLASTIYLKPPVKHIFPLCCISPCPGGRYFIESCKHGILQYTVIRPLTTIIAFICELCGVYGEGQFSAVKAYPYILAVNNVSQFVAMYSLVLFYKAYKGELAPMKPVAKFLCIKSVIFFSFFQSVIIAILVFTGVISKNFTTSESTKADIGRSLQDFLICIEMFLAAVAHYFAFSHRPYIDMAAEQAPCCWSFMSMWDVSDVTQDVSDHIRHVGKKVRMSVQGRKRTDSEEERCLLVSPPGEELGKLPSEGTNYNSIKETEPKKLLFKYSSENISEEIVDLTKEVEDPVKH